MRELNKIILYLLLTLIYLTSALAQSSQTYHLKLLAVQETPTGYEGSDADLYLELKPGNGHVFLNTYPVTKMDTQISTRFAKEIACKHYKLNCDQFDFLYTIQAKSSIIGGPSAGAAISAITAIAIQNLPINEKVAITGTINSGGIIGPVGGIKEKIQAAAKADLKKVLISRGNYPEAYPAPETSLNKPPQNNNTENNNTINSTAINSSNTNTTANIDLISYAKTNLSIDIIEVTTLDQALTQLTGQNISKSVTPLNENNQYTQIMNDLQTMLCQRSEKIKQEIQENNIILDENITKALQQKNQSIINATLKKDSYAIASICFTQNILLKNYYYQKEHLSPSMIATLIYEVEKKATSLETEVDNKKITTISDLQTKIVVKERLDDVKHQIKKYREQRPNLKPEEMYSVLSYTEERYFSATSWMQFFAMDGKKFQLDKDKMRETCTFKISEAEERNNYIGLFIPSSYLTNIQEQINDAKTAQNQDQQELCLIKSMEAKANANTIISSLGVQEQTVNEFISAKEQAAQQIIADNTAEGIFPILGYSYYQYAHTLKDSDKFTALLYLEYALELSDLQIYFPEEKSSLQTISESFSTTHHDILLIGEGMLIGILITLLLVMGIHVYNKSP